MHGATLRYHYVDGYIECYHIVTFGSRPAKTLWWKSRQARLTRHCHAIDYRYYRLARHFVQLL